jgi:hypothetical protein
MTCVTTPPPSTPLCCRCHNCLQMTFGMLAGPAPGSRASKLAGPVRAMHTTARCPAAGCGTLVVQSDWGYRLPEDAEMEAEVEARVRLRRM